MNSYRLLKQDFIEHMNYYCILAKDLYITEDKLTGRDRYIYLDCVVKNFYVNRTKTEQLD